MRHNADFATVECPEERFMISQARGVPRLGMIILKRNTAASASLGS
jgi:hypothetical protein